VDEIGGVLDTYRGADICLCIQGFGRKNLKDEHLEDLDVDGKIIRVLRT
jgi:hypothetical protein